MLKKVLIALVISIPLIIVGIAIYVSEVVFNTDNLCGENLLFESYSPNNDYKVLILERNCGATTDFSTLVTAQIPNSDSKTEIFLADDDHGVTPHGRGRSTRVETEWLAEDSLAIYHHPNARIYFSETKWNDLKIIYLGRVYYKSH
ncbi:MAG: DUF5412 family protein [Balneola sp.]|jgi:hypothetical protein